MYKLLSQKYWTDDVPCHFEFRNPQPPFPMHTHDFHEIAVIYSGEGIHMTPEGEKPVKTGDVISVRPGQIHGYNNVNKLVLMNILVHPSFFSDDSNNLTSVPGYADLFQPRTVSKKTESSVLLFNLNRMQLFEIQATIESMQKEIENQNLSWQVVTTSYLIQLVIILLRVYNDPSYPDTADKNNSAFLVKYMEKHYKQTLSMDDLLDVSAMSESSILRTFKRITGYPPFVFQMRLRIFAAINELTSTDRSITQIAYDTGFNDSNYFSRMFKKFTGISPKEYKEKFKVNNDIVNIKSVL
jgi:AraC-like DNA-binding protein